MRRALCLALAGVFLLEGCVTYDYTHSRSAQVLHEGERSRSTRELVYLPKRELEVRVLESFQRRERRREVYEGDFEAESFLVDVLWPMDTLEFGVYLVLIYPFVAPCEAILGLFTGSYALIESAFTPGDEEEELEYQAQTETPGVEVTLRSSDGATQTATTDDEGVARFDLFAQAFEAVRRGEVLVLTIEAAGAPSRTLTFTPEQTVDCAAPDPGESIPVRFHYWSELSKTVPSGPLAPRIVERRQLVDPSLLEQFRAVRDVPRSMSLEDLARLREHVERYERLEAEGKLEYAATDLHVVATLLQPHDPEDAERLHGEAVQLQARFAQRTWDALPNRDSFGMPSSGRFYDYCASGLSLTHRYPDRNARAVFVCLVAAAKRDDDVVREYNALDKASLHPDVARLIDEVARYTRPAQVRSSGSSTFRADMLQSQAEHGRAMDAINAQIQRDNDARTFNTQMRAHEDFMREFNKNY